MQGISLNCAVEPWIMGLDTKIDIKWGMVKTLIW